MWPQLTSKREELTRYIDRANSRDIPEDVQAYLARLGTVLVCGFIERSVEVIIIERLSNRAQGRILNFIRSHFKRGTNYDCEAIKQLLLRFDSDWYRRFSNFIDQNQNVLEGVSSVYGVRNSVAHGGSNSVGLGRLRELFDISQQLVNALIESTK